MRHVLQAANCAGTSLRCLRSSGDTRRGFGRADPLVTAMQLGGVNVTTVVQRCQSLTSCLQVDGHKAPRSEQKNCLAEEKLAQLLAKS